MARKTNVIFNTREQALSSDYNRVQQLSNKALMDLRFDVSRNDYHRNGNADLSFAVAGAARNVLQKAPTYVPSGVDFTVTIGAGEAALSQAPAANVSAFDVVAWNQTVLTFGTPDPTLSRIDVIYALSGESNTDPTVRVILQDPSTGTTAPAIVNKTNTSLATVLIAAGTPAANPHTTKGVVPAGAIALFEVIILPALTTADTFPCIRATERPHYEVMAATHGIIQGISLKCEGPYNEASGTVTILASGTGGANKALVQAVINGRLVSGFCGDQFESGAGAGGTLANMRPDTANNPFGSSDATKDTPYYVYMVPRISQGGGFFGAAAGSPFTLVESLTAPDDSGRPLGALTLDGVVQPIADCLYVGVGWRAKGQTYRKSFYWSSDDWVSSGSSNASTTIYYNAGTTFFDEDGAVGDGGRRTIPASGAASDFTIITRPAIPGRAINYKVRLWLAILSGNVDEGMTFYSSPSATSRICHPLLGFGVPYAHTITEVNLPENGIIGLRRIAGGSGITAVHCLASAYKMNVNRLSAMH